MPKDTKQLYTNLKDVLSKVGAIVDEKRTRMFFVTDAIIERSPKVFGVYRLAMKANLDN